MITDRDICIAFGTRSRLSGDVIVGGAISGKLYSDAPDEDIHVAPQTMKEGRVRRLPVVAKNGSLVGVFSMEDILLRTEPMSKGKEPELSSDEVVRTHRAITKRQVRQVVAKKVAAA